MPDYKFMEDFEEKLRENASKSAQELREGIAKNFQDEKGHIARDLRKSMEMTQAGMIPLEMQKFLGGNCEGAIFGGVDEDL